MSPKKHSSDFDPFSFVKYMKYIGRSHQKQAMELVSICRLFVQVGEQSDSQDAHLRKVLAVVDDALSFVADPENETSRTDEKFEDAVNALSDYEQRYHPKGQDVAKKMKSAKEKDKSSSGFLNKLKDSFTPIRKGKTKVVQFVLGFPGSSPNSVEQVLCEKSNVHEILWNFSRLKGDKRVNLKKNAHFYGSLSRPAHEYSGHFTTDPIENFWNETNICVLTDERSRVILETEKKRVFGNFWVPHKAIIFKDICGRLEGEGIVAQDIEGIPNLWHREEPREFSSPAGKPTTGSTDPNDPIRDRMFKDWRQLVRDALYSPNTSIRISTKDTPPEDQDQSWVPSSPTNPTRLSPARSSTLQARSTGASSGATAPRRRQTSPPVMPHSPALRPAPSPTGASGVVSHSPEGPTSITQNQNPPVAVPWLTAATPTHPHARPSTSATPQRPEPPPRQAAPTGAAPIQSGALTATILSQPQTTQPVISHVSVPQPAQSTRGPSDVVSPSPARSTSISQNQNPPVTVPPLTTVSTPTHPQTRLAVSQRLEPPPQQASPTGAAPIPPRALTATTLPQPQTTLLVMSHSSAPQPASSPRGASATAASPSPARPTSTSQIRNPPVAVSSSTTVAAPTPPQTRPATPQRLESPPRQAAPTGAAPIPPRPLTTALPQPQITLLAVMSRPSAPQPAPSPRGPLAAASPSPARPTSTSQNRNPPMAVPSSTTVAAPTHPQTRPATPQRLEPPPLAAAPTGAATIPPRALTAALPQSQTTLPTVMSRPSAPQLAPSPRGPLVAASPSPARPTSTSQNRNPPVAVPPSTTVATPPQPQTRPATPQRLDPPPRPAAPVGASSIPPRALTATPLSQPQTTLPVMPHSSVPQPAPSPRGPSAAALPSPVKPTSISQDQNSLVVVSSSITVATRTPIPDSAQTQKKNWFQRKIWDYKGK